MQCRLSQPNCTGPTYLSEVQISNSFMVSQDTSKIKGNLVKVKTCIRIHSMAEASFSNFCKQPNPYHHKR